MIVIAVDDESWALNELKDMLNDLPEISEVAAFYNSSDALAWAQENPFDAAFLDINMRGMGGLELGRRLREINHKCGLVFCTGYGEYMPEAFDIHANGYLMKPILLEKLQREIAYIESLRHSEYQSKTLLTIKCAGGFEVYDKNGSLVEFKRSKAKELLALLVHRHGMSITSKEICALFWEDDGELDQKNMTYLWKLFSDLNKTLSKIGADNVLRRTSSGHFIDMELVDCQDADRQAADYMSGYAWAQELLS